jgi:peptidyl-prolyl cis-trans isomerase B (cyclophilin B)
MSTHALEQWASPPAMAIDVTKKYVATLKTVKGDIAIALLPWEAPITANNFVFLARQGFYEGMTFHRVGVGIAQTGDPTGTGRGGPGYTVPDESRTIPIDEGVVAMANMGTPHTSGSQFFIARETRHQLNGSYNVFGRVIAGMDVVHRISPRDTIAAGHSLPPGDEVISVRVQEL